MGDEFGGAEAVHKFLIDVEFQVRYPVPDAFDFRQALHGCQCQCGAAQRTVAEGFIAFQRQIRQQALGTGWGLPQTRAEDFHPDPAGADR